MKVTMSTDDDRSSNQGGPELNDGLDDFWGDHFEVMKEESRKQKAKDDAVLESVSKLLSSDEYKLTIKGFSDCMHVCDFEIVDEASGEDQCEDWDNGTTYCNQSGGGMTGDDYYGEYYIPLPADKYFKYSYSC